MGTLAGTVCYPDAVTATDAYFSAIVPTPTVAFQNDGSGWFRVGYNASGVVSSSSVAAAPVLPSCDHLAGFNDGLTVGAALVGALVVASLVGIMSRAMP